MGWCYEVHIICGCLISQKDATEIYNNYSIAPMDWNLSSSDEEEECLISLSEKPYIAECKEVKETNKTNKITEIKEIKETDKNKEIKESSEIKEIKETSEIKETKEIDKSKTSSGKSEKRKIDQLEPSPAKTPKKLKKRKIKNINEHEDGDCSIKRKIINPPKVEQGDENKNIYLFNAVDGNSGDRSWCIFYDKQDYEVGIENEMELKPVDMNEMNKFKMIVPLFDVAGNRIRLIRELCSKQLNYIKGLVDIIVEYYMKNPNKRAPLCAGQYAISSLT